MNTVVLRRETSTLTKSTDQMKKKKKKALPSCLRGKSKSGSSFEHNNIPHQRIHSGVQKSTTAMSNKPLLPLEKWLYSARPESGKLLTMKPPTKAYMKTNKNRVELNRRKCNSSMTFTEQKIAQNISQVVSVQTNAASTVTTVLVSPPPDKLVVNGKKCGSRYMQTAPTKKEEPDQDIRQKSALGRIDSSHGPGSISSKSTFSSMIASLGSCRPAYKEWSADKKRCRTPPSVESAVAEPVEGDGLDDCTLSVTPEKKRKESPNIVQVVSVATHENSTLTTVLVLPPPNKPIVRAKVIRKKRKNKKLEKRENKRTSSLTSDLSTSTVPSDKSTTVLPSKQSDQSTSILPSEVSDQSMNPLPSELSELSTIALLPDPSTIALTSEMPISALLSDPATRTLPTDLSMSSLPSDLSINLRKHQGSSHNLLSSVCKVEDSITEPSGGTPTTKSLHLIQEYSSNNNAVQSSGAQDNLDTVLQCTISETVDPAGPPQPTPNTLASDSAFVITSSDSETDCLSSQKDNKIHHSTDPLMGTKYFSNDLPDMGSSTNIREKNVTGLPVMTDLQCNSASAQSPNYLLEDSMECKQVEIYDKSKISSSENSGEYYHVEAADKCDSARILSSTSASQTSLTGSHICDTESSSFEAQPDSSSNVNSTCSSGSCNYLRTKSSAPTPLTGLMSSDAASKNGMKTITAFLKTSLSTLPRTRGQQKKISHLPKKLKICSFGPVGKWGNTLLKYLLPTAPEEKKVPPCIPSSSKYLLLKTSKKKVSTNIPNSPKYLVLKTSKKVPTCILNSPKYEKATTCVPNPPKYLPTKSLEKNVQLVQHSSKYIQSESLAVKKVTSISDIPVPSKTVCITSDVPGLATKNQDESAENIDVDKTADTPVVLACFCKLMSSLNRKPGRFIYCQALETAGNEVRGCGRKVTGSHLLRPGPNIPYMALCDVHFRLLQSHRCCPACGHFCTEGRFQQCLKEGLSSLHVFHSGCVVKQGDKDCCPHCSEEVTMCQVEFSLDKKRMKETGPDPYLITEIKNKQAAVDLVLRRSTRQEMAVVSQNYKKVKSTSLEKISQHNKTVGADASSLGPDLQALTLLHGYIAEGSNRTKRCKALSKNLYTCAAEGNIEKVLLFLVEGADPSTRYEACEGQTALHAASVSGHVSIIFLLLQFGANIHAQDRKLWTPIMCAAESGCLTVVQFLLQAGAKLEDRGEDGMTGLHFAAKAGHLEVVKYILTTGRVDVDVQDEGGWTAMMWATESRLPHVVTYLLSQGADPHQRDNEENTCLHWAAVSGSKEIAEMFLDLGCEIHAVNEHGDHPIHIAARHDHYAVVALLLARGANVFARNNKNESPVESLGKKSGKVWMALTVNQQLRGMVNQLNSSDMLLQRDISKGKEKSPIACVNSMDSEPCPSNFLYVSRSVVTGALTVNNLISSLQSCQCRDNCLSAQCRCNIRNKKTWYDKAGLLPRDVDWPESLFECNKACRCWANCGNRVTQNGIQCHLQLFKTTKKGWGVRTLTDILRGTFVCEFVGEMISNVEAERRVNDSYMFEFHNQRGEVQCLDASCFGNIGRFINHSCQPNLAAVRVYVDNQPDSFPRLCLFAGQDIQAHQELVFDYGDKFWALKPMSWRCLCESDNCRYSQHNVTLQQS